MNSVFTEVHDFPKIDNLAWYEADEVNSNIVSGERAKHWNLLHLPIQNIATHHAILANARCHLLWTPSKHWPMSERQVLAPFPSVLVWGERYCHMGKIIENKIHWTKYLWWDKAFVLFPTIASLFLLPGVLISVTQHTNIVFLRFFRTRFIELKILTGNYFCRSFKSFVELPENVTPISNNRGAISYTGLAFRRIYLY